MLIFFYNSHFIIAADINTISIISLICKLRNKNTISPHDYATEITFKTFHCCLSLFSFTNKFFHDFISFMKPYIFLHHSPIPQIIFVLFYLVASLLLLRDLYIYQFSNSSSFIYHHKIKERLFTFYNGN